MANPVIPPSDAPVTPAESRLTVRCAAGPSASSCFFVILALAGLGWALASLRPEATRPAGDSGPPAHERNGKPRPGANAIAPLAATRSTPDGVLIFARRTAGQTHLWALVPGDPAPVQLTVRRLGRSRSVRQPRRSTPSGIRLPPGGWLGPVSCSICQSGEVQAPHRCRRVSPDIQPGRPMAVDRLRGLHGRRLRHLDPSDGRRPGRHPAEPSRDGYLADVGSGLRSADRIRLGCRRRRGHLPGEPRRPRRTVRQPDTLARAGVLRSNVQSGWRPSGLYTQARWASDHPGPRL